MASAGAFLLLSILEGLAGGALVLLVLTDVFRSVIVPRAANPLLRLGPFFRRPVLRWWLALASRRQQAGRRHDLLGILGPLLLVLELVLWVALLIVGYGLLLHALRSGIKPEPDYEDALFASASAFMTLGLSAPQEAVSNAVRFVVILAAGSGLTVLTLVVTFLLSVQEALRQREALVLRLRARTGPKPSGPAILEAHAKLASEHDAALREFFTNWEEWGAQVLLTHRAYPILAYFRSHDEDCEWLAALGAVLDAAALVAATRHEGAVEHAVLCHVMGTRVLRELADQFGLHPPDAPDMDRAAFTASLRRLEQSGYRTGADGEAWERFRPLRTEYHRPLAALMQRFGVASEGW